MGMKSDKKSKPLKKTPIRKKRSKNEGVSDGYLDTLVREYIQLTSGGYCKRCKRYVGVSNIATAHIYRRRRKTVRWDLRNVIPLCDNPPLGMNCHQDVDNDSLKMVSFLYEIKTPEEIKELQELAGKTIKDYPIDREEIKRDLKEKIKRLKGK